MINTISGMNFFVDYLNIDYLNIPAAFAFQSNPVTATDVVNPDPWAIYSSSGILNTVGGQGFFSNSGTGSFNGSTYFILNKDYSFNNSTILFSFERFRNADEILFSSVTGNNFNNYSGFYIGVNEANKLYLKYWNNVEGIFTFTYTGILSNKNLIVVNKTDSIITIAKFNNNDKSLESQEFEIYENNFINNSKLYVGGSPNVINWSSNISNFSGYIDKFYIYNDIPFIYSNVLCSGLFSEPTGFEGITTEYCYDTGYFSGSGFYYTGVTGIFVSGFLTSSTGITGYSNIVTGYSYTGVTGYSGKLLGSYMDNCGIIQNIIEQVPLSGLINVTGSTQVALTGIIFSTGFVDIPMSGTLSGVQNIPITGTVCNNYFQLTGKVTYNYDENYLSSLSYNEISLLSEIKTPNDIVEIYTSPYKNEYMEYNKNLSFDNLNKNYFYLDKDFLSNELTLFANGQALVDSGYQLIPDNYEIIRQANFDYFITGRTVETNKEYSQEDFLFYDYYKNRNTTFINNQENVYNTGLLIASQINTPYTGFDKFFVFKNGQKLLSGIDYEKTSSIFAVGRFISYKGNSSINAILLNNNGNFDPYFDDGIGFTGPVRKVILDNDKFVVGGEFTGYRGVVKNKIARLFQSGNLDPTFTGSLNNGNIYTLCKHKDKYLIGGDFTTVNNISQLRISRLNLDGSVDTSFNLPGSGFNNTVNSIFVDQNDNIYVAGAFSGYNGFTINRIAKLNISGNLDTGFNYNYFYENASPSATSAISTTFLEKNGNILIGGNFTGINSSGVFSRFARLDTNGNPLTGITINGTVISIDKDSNNNIVLGGGFTLLNGISASRLAVLNPNFNIIHSGTSINSNVLSVKVQNDNKIIIGGVFTGYNNIRYNKILRLNSDYTVDNTFTNGNGFSTSATDLVYDILCYDNIKLNISGSGDVFMVKEVPEDFIRITGSSGSYLIPNNYNNNTAVVFMNGIKQKLNNNFIENSKFDLISGIFYEPDQYKDIIYNNTDDFFV